MERLMYSEIRGRSETNSSKEFDGEKSDHTNLSKSLNELLGGKLKISLEVEVSLMSTPRP